MAQSTSTSISGSQELQYCFKLLHSHGYVAVPVERYYEMVRFCAEYGACGFKVVDEEGEDGAEKVN